MTFDFGNALFYGSLAAPLLVGIVGIFANSKDRDRLGLGATLLLLLASIGLSLVGERQILTPFTFMNTPINFSISQTGVCLHIALVLALALLFWLGSKSGRPTTLYAFLLVQISLSAGFLALMSGQFMIRYIALDIVGLIAALSILNSFSDPTGLKRFIVIFQILRLGDLFLLLSILLTNAFAGTYDIAQMISTAAELPPSSRTWVFLGFVLAVLIKLAIWPFGIWLRYTREGAHGVGFWTAGFLMPVLGLYLLYRIVPIIQVEPGFQIIILVFSLGSLILTLLMYFRNMIPNDRFLLMNSLIGCFALSVAAVPGTDYFGYYLAALILTRLVIFLGEPITQAGTSSWLWIPLMVVNGAFLWVNASAWPTLFMILWGALTLIASRQIGFLFLAGARGSQPNPLSADTPITEDALNSLLFRSAQWVNQKLEKNLLSKGFSAVSRWFVVLAAWLLQHIEGGFDRIWSGMARGLTRVSEATLATLEVRPAEKTDDLVDGTLQKLAVYESNVLKKTLRWDLALVPLFLLVILALLFLI